MIFHVIPDELKYGGQESEISVRLFEGPWERVTETGQRLATREDIMMV